MLTNRDIVELTDLRRALHRRPELSGEEAATAAFIAAALGPARPDRVVAGLGGHGLAAIWDAPHPGPGVMFRAELDALPIVETGTSPHRSETPGKGHLCGHDGHMAILLALARLIGRDRPERGRVILMFQPAEEDGAGAAAVVADPRYADIAPDWAFAIHNVPGVPFGQALLAPGVVNCASTGMRLTLRGRTAHASQPETGVSPAGALARLLPALSALGPGGALGPDYRLVTVTHARLGVPAFGIAPGEAEIWATLRTVADAPMAALRDEACALAGHEAAADGLALDIAWQDDFAASVNDPDATLRAAAALDALGIAHGAAGLPMRASEDFGRFGRPPTKSAMVFLGAGTGVPALHNPDYDFPDALIPIGAGVFHRILTDLTG